MGSIDSILQLLETRGGKAYLGEPLSQRAHALQTAHLAMADGASDALVAAALLHDLGHLLYPGPEATEPQTDKLHEERASAWLAQHFGLEVTEPIRQHVIAKRYLCTVDPTYRRLLSPASVRSLGLQGLLAADDIDGFEQNPFHQDAIRLRRWDDQAKLPALVVPGAEHYIPILQRIQVVIDY